MLVNRQAAFDLCEREEDLRVRQLMMGLSTQIHLESMKEGGAGSSTDIDLEFILRAAKLFFENTALLEQILAGRDMRWWAD